MMAVKLKRREQGHAKMLDTHSTTSEQTNNTSQTERERVRTGERPASGGEPVQAGRRAGEQRVNVDGAANWRCTTERHTTAGSDRAGQRRTANPPDQVAKVGLAHSHTAARNAPLPCAPVWLAGPWQTTARKQPFWGSPSSRMWPGAACHSPHWPVSAAQGTFQRKKGPMPDAVPIFRLR